MKSGQPRLQMLLTLLHAHVFTKCRLLHGSRISWLQLHGTGMKAYERCRYFRQFHCDFLLGWRHKETLLLSVLHSQVLNHFISELNLNLITVNLLDWLNLCFLSEELKSECQRSAHEDFPAERNTSPFPPPFPLLLRGGNILLTPSSQQICCLHSTVFQLYSRPGLKLYPCSVYPITQQGFLLS